MVIDCHGHYTTAPKELQTFRETQIAALTNPAAQVPSGPIDVSDDQLRESVQPQLKFQSDRGTDVTIFSPRASAMAHHIGDARTSLDWDSIDLVELNEAFAAQVLAVLAGWGWNDHDKLNVNGSGISLGHPIGATGARILATGLRELRRRGGRYLLETMCVGGGQGVAAIFEAA